jgi:hypothetical protein
VAKVVGAMRVHKGGPKKLEWLMYSLGMFRALRRMGGDQL